MPGEAAKLVAGRPDVIFHLAAIVSGEAEQDFDKGYRINLDGTRKLFEAIRAIGDGYKPRVVFTSSIAVFGAPFPDAIGDEFFTTPLTSYGTQKAIGELLLSDYSRKGIFDGVGIRLPTICVRPGNAEQGGVGLLLQHHPRAAGRPRGRAAGAPRTCATGTPRRARRSASCSMPRRIDTAIVGPRRDLTMPGLSVTVGEQIEALRRVAGEKVVARIRREPDADDHEDRRGLAAQLRPQARDVAGLQGRDRPSTRSSTCISTTSWAARSLKRNTAYDGRANRTADGAVGRNEGGSSRAGASALRPVQARPLRPTAS